MDQFYLSSSSQNFPSTPSGAHVCDVVYTTSVPHHNQLQPFAGYRQETVYPFGTFSQNTMQPPPQRLAPTGYASSDGRKSKEIPLDVIARRRAQNRASQRAYRNRKDNHIRNLETRLSETKGKYEKLIAEHEHCSAEYEKLREAIGCEAFENERLKDRLRDHGSEAQLTYASGEEESFDGEEYDGQLPTP